MASGDSGCYGAGIDTADCSSAYLLVGGTMYAGGGARCMFAV